jgi:hypothetical protein
MNCLHIQKQNLLQEIKDSVRVREEVNKQKALDLLKQIQAQYSANTVVSVSIEKESTDG